MIRRDLQRRLHLALVAVGPEHARQRHVPRGAQQLHRAEPPHGAVAGEGQVVQPGGAAASVAHGTSSGSVGPYTSHSSPRKSRPNAVIDPIGSGPFVRNVVSC